MVSGQSHHEDLYIWPDHHPYEPQVPFSDSKLVEGTTDVFSLPFRPHWPGPAYRGSRQGIRRHHRSIGWSSLVSGVSDSQPVPRRMTLRWFISVYLPLHAPARHRRSNPLDTPPYFRSLFRSSARPGFTSRSRIASTSTSTAAGTGSRSSTDVTATLRHRWGNGNRLGGEAL